MLYMFRFSQDVQKDFHKMFRKVFTCLELQNAQKCVYVFSVACAQLYAQMFRLFRCLEKCSYVQNYKVLRDVFMCLALHVLSSMLRCLDVQKSALKAYAQLSCLANLDAQQSGQVFTRVLRCMLRCLVRCLGVHNIMCLARCFSNLYIQQNI